MQISLSSRITGVTAARTNAEIDVLLSDARPWLYRLALAITASPDTAEDVAQEALARAARSRNTLATVTEPKAWLRTVLVRCAISTPTRRTLKPQKETTNQDPTETVAVHLTLSRMNAGDRAILALAHFEQLSYAEIAQALDIPVGTVASRLHNAREAFRKEWQK